MTTRILRAQAGGGGPQTYPNLILGWDSERAGRTIVQDVIGGGVVVTALRGRPRTGTLRLFYMDETDAVDAFNMHDSSAHFTFTNEGDEQRRNLIIYNPGLHATAGWSIYNSTATATPTPYGMQWDITGDVLKGSNLLYTAGEVFTAPGVHRSSAMIVTVPFGYPALAFDLRTQGYGSSLVLGASGTIVVAPGESAQISAPATMYAGPASTGVRPILKAGEILPAGGRFIVRDALVEATRVPGPTFNGSFSPDPALIPSWLGTPDASESILSTPGKPWQGMSYVVADGGCRIIRDEQTQKRWIVEVDYQELQPA